MHKKNTYNINRKKKINTLKRDHYNKYIESQNNKNAEINILLNKYY